MTTPPLGLAPPVVERTVVASTEPTTVPRKHSPRRVLLLAAGFISLAIGAIGILIPVLPTTPFTLLAAACFARSSPRFSRALEQSRLFGPFIANYRYRTGISVRRKIVTLAFLWTGLVISMVITHRLWLIVLLAVIGTAVSTHVLMLKTKSAIASA